MKGLLGDHQITIRYFDGLDAIFKRLKAVKDGEQARRDLVNKALLDLVEGEEEPCFLLPAVLEFITSVTEEKILDSYEFNHFELWLNQVSGLSFEQNRRIRGKIAGKWVARSDYQGLFPIGMGKVYEGTHFVTAHKSPDLDTTIASFWGWLDAFAARVGDGLHVWNVPGGPPVSQIEIEWIFRDLFGPGIFSHLPKTRHVLSVTGKDLMSQKAMHRKPLHASIAEIDHDRDQNAIVVVDDEGQYIGDWRATDVEGVRQVIILVGSCLRWFENSLQIALISIFAKKDLRYSDVVPELKKLLETKLADCEPGLEFSSKQKRQVDEFLKRVLDLKKGLETDFADLGDALGEMSGIPFGGAEHLAEKMKKAGLFDPKGNLADDRPKIFHFLEKEVESLHLGIIKIRARLEKIDIALKAKLEVFGHSPTTISTSSDVEEILTKMTHYSHLTVVHTDKQGVYPLGVIQAEDLRKTTLGTVSLRDFCNREEMGIPSYLEVISVIDHHKSSLNTFSPPMAVIADVQSSNTLVAQKAFEVNDLYAAETQDEKRIESHLEEFKKKSSSESLRILKRLLDKKLNAHKKGGYFIHSEREYIEYLHFLYGIIDDTDLLSKVSVLDVECVAQLLNRLKSLSVGKEVEIINFDGIERDKDFAKKAAARILQNEDMYSLYSRVYKFREKEVAKNISLCAAKEPSNLFADTKEQNGCCRVGQTKMFSANVSSFEKEAQEIRHVWLEKAKSVQKLKPEIDLHIHMVSTIVDAEEVYKGTVGKYSHKDELWIWCAENEMALEHLRRFLNAFQRSPGLKNNPLELELTGANAEVLATIFKESFLDIPTKVSKKGLPIAILKYKAGSLNSRKAMVSPFLPTLSH